MIHFDANFLVAALAENTAAAALLDGWVEKSEELAISTVAYAEFLCGPLSAEAETESNRSRSPFRSSHKMRKRRLSISTRLADVRAA